MSFGEFTAAYRRRDILVFLKDCGGRLNDEVLRTAVEGMGNPLLSREVIRDDIAFLRDRRLLREEWLDDILVAHITKRGVEVAEGRIKIDGVQKPQVGV
jgi:hypothetical protein